MRSFVATAVVLLSACAGTMENMAAKPADGVYKSARGRTAVADCLLDRVSSDELVPQRQVSDHQTTIGFASRGIAMQPAIYLFVIRDNGAGSTIEARRFAKASLANAETCF